MFVVYFKQENGNFRTYNGNEYKDENCYLMGCHFELNKSYDKTDESLKEYYGKMIVWSNEIASTFNIDFKYIDSFTDIIASTRLIKIMCFKHYQYMDEIDSVEANYIEKPYNGGLMYVKQMKKAHNTYSNDKNNFYSDIMGNPDYDFYFPDKSGYEVKIDTISLDTLKYGFYNIQIKPKCDDAYKIFSFNYKNWYNYYCVKFVLENEDYFDYEIINDDKYNAYLYDSVVKSSDIFNGWLKKIEYLKRRFPNNKLVKNLSRAWGGLSMMNSIKINENEILDNPDKYENYEIVDTYIYDETTIYKIKKIDDNIYKFNIRLKSWINSFCRVQIAKTIIRNIDSVVRVQTDSISYNKDIQPDKTEKREEKTTGYIRFTSVNNYHHKCKVCKNYLKHKLFKNHECLS
jgi:hypothetical protein